MMLVIAHHAHGTANKLECMHAAVSRATHQLSPVRTMTVIITTTPCVADSSITLPPPTSSVLWYSPLRTHVRICNLHHNPICVHVQNSIATAQQWRALSFADLAHAVMSQYISEQEVPSADLKRLVHASYKTFRHEGTLAVAVTARRHGYAHSSPVIDWPLFVSVRSFARAVAHARAQAVQLSLTWN
jgi:Threonine synthase N terminus